MANDHDDLGGGRPESEAAPSVGGASAELRRVAASIDGAEEPVPSGQVRRETAREPVLIELINARTLERETFARSIEMMYEHVSIGAFASVADWFDSRDPESASVILFNVGAREPSGPEVVAALGRIVLAARPLPVIVLGESEDPLEMIAAIDAGAVGYLPASIGLDIIMEATELACTGGLFLPLGSLASLRRAGAPRPAGDVDRPTEPFTSRQAAVAEALRHGKANKIIAFELNMSESTVKVHVRNIMKKLGATNRTEAAFKLNSMFRGTDVP